MVFGAARVKIRPKTPPLLCPALTLLLVLTVAQNASACETVLTHAEIAANRARAVEFFGPSNSAFLGYTVNSAGDVNGDGFDDLALFSTQRGVFLVFGRGSDAWASAAFDFSEAETPDPASWIRITGEIGNNGLAFGDFNGDGVSDLLLGGCFKKTAFCVFGHEENWTSFDTADIESGDVSGFALIGGELYESSNKRKIPGNAGDMNGDGIEDILVAVSDGTNPSVVYVVFGTEGETRATFNLSTVDGTNGFSLMDGSKTFGYVNAFGSVGDVNGDGLEDLAIGSSGANSNAGCAYVIFARNVSESAQEWLGHTNEIDGTNGFIVEGPSSGNLGWTTVGAGDVNGDGFEDVFIGSGTTYGSWIVFGGSAPFSSPIDASQLDGTNGFRFYHSSSYWGCIGGGVGDVNGDGFDDVVIGGLDAYSSTGQYRSGAVVLIYGHSGSWPALLKLSDAVGSVGFYVDGPAADYSQFGFSARGAGDVNGDGLSDFVVGAPQYFSFAGYAALVLGTNDHCTVCSNTSEICLVCNDGFFPSGPICNTTCTPGTCASFGYECGTQSDGCSGTIECGTCTSPDVCTNGQCIPAGTSSVVLQDSSYSSSSSPVAPRGQSSSSSAEASLFAASSGALHIVSSSSTPSGGGSALAIALGIAILVIAVIAAAIFLGIFLARRRKNKKHSVEMGEAPNAQLSTTPTATATPSESATPVNVTRFFESADESLTYQGSLGFAPGYVPPPSCRGAVLASEAFLLPRVPLLREVVAECEEAVMSIASSPDAKALIVQHGLSREEVFALVLYTFDIGLKGKPSENFFFQLNEILRARSQEGLAAIQGFMWFASSALRKLPDFDGIVFRGNNSPDIVAREYTKGREIFWSGFTSTTIIPSVARQFAGSSGVVFRISVKHGKDISAFSAVSTEKEVLLRPNTQLFVSKEIHTKADGIQYVDLLEKTDKFTY